MSREPRKREGLEMRPGKEPSDSTVCMASGPTLRPTGLRLPSYHSVSLRVHPRILPLLHVRLFAFYSVCRNDCLVLRYTTVANHCGPSGDD